VLLLFGLATARITGDLLFLTFTEPILHYSYPLPDREVKRVIDWNLIQWIGLFSLVYYLAHIWYLAKGLSVAHSMSVNKLFLLGILGTIVGFVVSILLGIAIFSAV
jgi:hypothetical protein